MPPVRLAEPQALGVTQFSEVAAAALQEIQAQEVAALVVEGRVPKMSVLDAEVVAVGWEEVQSAIPMVLTPLERDRLALVVDLLRHMHLPVESAFLGSVAAAEAVVPLVLALGLGRALQEVGMALTLMVGLAEMPLQILAPVVAAVAQMLVVVKAALALSVSGGMSKELS